MASISSWSESAWALQDSISSFRSSVASATSPMDSKILSESMTAIPPAEAVPSSAAARRARPLMEGSPFAMRAVPG